jgi:hypothetical protein
MRLGERDAVHLGHVHVEHGQRRRLACGDPCERFRGRFGVARVHAPLRRLQRQHARLVALSSTTSSALAREPGCTPVMLCERAGGTSATAPRS